MFEKKSDGWTNNINNIIFLLDSLFLHKAHVKNSHFDVVVDNAKLKNCLKHWFGSMIHFYIQTEILSYERYQNGLRMEHKSEIKFLFKLCLHKLKMIKVNYLIQMNRLTWQRRIKGSLHFLQVNSFGWGKFLRSNHAGFPPTLLGKNFGCKSQLSFSSRKPISTFWAVILFLNKPLELIKRGM